MPYTIKKIISYLHHHKEQTGAFAVLALFSFITNFWSSKIVESDNLVHLAYAGMYRLHGIFFHDFVWDTFSVFSIYHSDMWYGFHILLVPFSYITDPTLAIHLSGFFLTFILASTMYIIFKKMSVRSPLFWTLALFLSSFLELHRMTDPRPQIISSALAASLIYFLAWKINTKAIFAISAIWAWVEVSMVWLPVAIFGLDYFSQWLDMEISRQGKNRLELFKCRFKESFTFSPAFCWAHCCGQTRLTDSTWPIIRSSIYTLRNFEECPCLLEMNSCLSKGNTTSSKWLR